MSLILLIGAALAATNAAPALPCSGRYGSDLCTHKIELNGCKNSIQIKWPPLQMPGTQQWAAKKRNWCTVTWDGEGAIEEKKLEPEKCSQLLQILANGKQIFPEIKWQDATCTHQGSSDGILYSRPSQTSEPATRRLEDVGRCQLFTAKKRLIRCPLLQENVQNWLKKLATFLGAEFQTSNVIK